MNSKFETFAQTLELTAVDTQALISKLGGNADLGHYLSGKGGDATCLTNLACELASFALGASAVDQKPLNQTAADNNWSEACWLAPTCIVTPASPHDVSNALKIINFFQTKFAVRSGGHSPNPGWSNINGPGILIDLSKLNQVTVSADKKVASLGPGGRWGDVYEALDPYGISVIGGRIPHVGVAGVILGGGFFHFSGQYGLAADNVKNFEIVLADGTITNASATQNSDLFWALKGGGPNFGIVTRFDLYTIPVHNIWYQVGAYAASDAPAIIDAFAEWQENGASDTKGTVALIIGLEVITLGLIYSEPASKPASFGPFYDITPLAVAVPPTNGTVLSITQILGTTFSNVPQRHDYRAAATKIDAKLYKDVYASWRTQALAVQASTGANQTFTLQPIPVNLVNQGIAKGGNALGMPQINFQWWTTLVDWNDANDDAAVRAVSIATSEKFKSEGQSRGSYVPFLFMNDCSRDQSPISLYGAKNIAKLKAVSLQYDPNQVFQKLQNDGFLLRNV